MTPTELNALIKFQEGILPEIEQSLLDSVRPIGGRIILAAAMLSEAFLAGFRAGLVAGRQSEGIIRRDTVCPDCGADWRVVAEMLAELPTWERLEPPIGSLKTLVESENHALARAMLVNCWTCQKAVRNG